MARTTWAARVRRAAALLLRGPSAATFPAPAPVLSVVVPVYQVERYLDECLDSVRTQSYPHLEVVLVDDGSTDRSSDIAAAHAARDPRLRLVRTPNAGLGAARNTGAGLATGTYLTFLDSDDVLEPGAYETLVGTLEESGSDFAVGCYCRYDGTRCVPAASWIRQNHARDRLGTRLVEDPGALVNAVAWSKVYRRSFWSEQGLRFPEGVLYEDQELSARAYACARRFDVVRAVTHRWRVRDDRSSITQQLDTAPDLRARLAAARGSLAVLAELAGTEVAQERRVQLLAHDLPASVVRVPVADDEFWSVLAEGVRELAAGLRDEDWLALPVAARAMTHLVLHGSRDELTRFLAEGGRELRRHPWRVDRGQVVVQLPLPPSVPPAVRHRLGLLPPEQAPLVVRLAGARWLDGTRLELRCRAELTGVDLGDADVHVRADAVRRPRSAQASGEQRRVRLDTCADPPDRAARLAGAVGARVVLDVGALTAEHALSARRAEWGVEVQAEVAGLHRVAVLLLLPGTTELPGAQVQPSGWRVAPRVQDEPSPGEVRVEVRRVRALARAVRLEDRALRVDLDAVGPAPQRLVAVGSGTDRRLTAPLHQGPGGSWSASLALPAAAPGGSRRRSSWLVKVVDDREREHPVSWPYDLPAPVADGADGRVWAARTAGGHLRVEEQDGVVVVHGVRLTDAELQVDVLERGDGQGRLSYALRGRGVRVLPVQTARHGGRLRLHFPLAEVADSSAGELALRAARGAPAAPRRVSQRCDPGLLAQLPLELDGPAARLRLTCASGTLRLATAAAGPVPPP